MLNEQLENKTGVS